MIHARQADSAALIRDSIVQCQMARADLDADAVTVQDENAGFADGVRVR